MNQQNPPVYKSNSEDTFCLKTEVRTILATFGVFPKYELYDAYFDIFATSLGVDAFHKLSVEYQRMFMNRYWNSQLNSLTALQINTIEERFCLVPNGEISDWLNLFRQRVAPCAMVNGLPVDLEMGMTVH